MKIQGLLFGTKGGPLSVLTLISIVIVILVLNSSSFAHGKKILRRVRTRQTGGYGYVNGISSGGYGQRFQQPSTPSTTPQPQPQPSPEPQNVDFGTTTEYPIESENSNNNDESGYGGGSTFNSIGDTVTSVPELQQAQVGYSIGGYDLSPLNENRDSGSSSSSTEISANNNNNVQNGNNGNRNFQASSSGGYSYNFNGQNQQQQGPVVTEPRKQSPPSYSTPNFEQIPALTHQPTPTRTQYEQRLSQTSYYNNQRQQQQFGGYGQSVEEPKFSRTEPPRTRILEESYPAVPKAPRTNNNNNNLEQRFPNTPQTPKTNSGVEEKRTSFPNENTITFHGIGNADDDDESEMSFEGLNNSIVDEELLEKVQQIIAQHEREEREYFARLRSRENENSQAQLPEEQNLQQANIYSTQSQQQPQAQTFNSNNEQSNNNNNKRPDEPPHHFIPSNPNIEFTPSILTGQFSEAGRPEGRNSNNQNSGQRSGKQYLPPSPSPSPDTVVIGGIMQPMYFVQQNQREHHFLQGTQNQESDQPPQFQNQAQQQYIQYGQPPASTEDYRQPKPQIPQQYSQAQVQVQQPQPQYAQPQSHSQQYPQSQPQTQSQQYPQSQPQTQSYQFPQSQPQAQSHQYPQPQSQQYPQSQSQQYSQSQPESHSQQYPQSQPQQYTQSLSQHFIQSQPQQYPQPQVQSQQYTQFYNVPQFQQSTPSQPPQEQYSGITMAYFLTPEQAKSPFAIPEPQMIPSTFPQMRSQPEEGYNSNEQQSNVIVAGRQYLPPSAQEQQPIQLRNNLNQGAPAINYGPTISRTIVIHEHPTPFPTTAGDLSQSQQRNRALITPQDFHQQQQQQQYGVPTQQSFETNELGPAPAIPSAVPTPTYRFLQASTQLTVSNGEFGADNVNSELEKPKPIYGIPLAPVLEEPSGPSNYLPPSAPSSGPNPTIESTHVLQAVYRLPQQAPSGSDRDHQQQLQELNEQPQSQEVSQTYYGVPSFGQRRMLRKRYFNSRTL